MKSLSQAVNSCRQNIPGYCKFDRRSHMRSRIFDRKRKIASFERRLRPFAAVSPTLRSTLQKSSTNLIVNSSPRSSILVIVYITSSLQKKTLHAAVIVLEKDNTPFNYPILNSCSLKTVSSIDVYLNLDDCILHYSPMCSLNFVHIVRIVRLILHFILCN